MMAPLLVTIAKCDTCFFSRRSGLGHAKKKETLARLAKYDLALCCHKGQVKGQYVTCRGFFDRYTSTWLEGHKEAGAIEFVDVPGWRNAQ